MSVVAAISTPFGVGAISIIRMSGKGSLDIASKFFKTKKLVSFTKATPNFAYVGKVSDGIFTDTCLAIYFKAPFSYTGEDLVELQCHGGVLLAKKILELCIKNGAAPASKGEFTKRAFLNNKVSLLEAEGVLDMIKSESSSALSASSRVLSSDFIKSFFSYQNFLKSFIAKLETSLDYPDEYGFLSTKDVGKIQTLISELQALLNFSKNSDVLKSGFNISIIGPPNAGKSSLLNSLLKKEKAIVSDMAGTTRDVVEGSIEYNGIVLNFFDTAGLRNSKDRIEKIGIKKAYDNIQSADLLLLVLDGSVKTDVSFFSDLIQQNKDKPVLVILNKSDLKKYKQKLPFKVDLSVSIKENKNIEGLVELIYITLMKSNVDVSSELLLSTRVKQSIKESIISLNGFLEGQEKNLPAELLLLDLKNAYFSLGLITGSTANEDIINEIFNQFCVGK